MLAALLIAPIWDTCHRVRLFSAGRTPVAICIGISRKTKNLSLQGLAGGAIEDFAAGAFIPSFASKRSFSSSGQSALKRPDKRDAGENGCQEVRGDKNQQPWRPVVGSYPRQIPGERFLTCIE